MSPQSAVLVLTVTSCILAGCGPAEGEDPDPHADITAGADAGIRLVAEDEADLTLYVSNQSFDDPEVRLTVTVDGVTVVEDDFHVEGQHNWLTFPLRIAPGAHEITAASDSGATLTESFRIPRDAPRYAVIDHWGEGDSADLSWTFSRRPVAFQ